MTSAIQKIHDTTNQSDRYAAYEHLLNKQVSSKNIKAIEESIDFLLTREASDQYARTYIVPDVLKHLIIILGDDSIGGAIDLDDLRVLLRYMVDILRNRIDDFGDALMLSIDLLAKCYQADKDFKSAALTLSSFKPDEYRGKCSTTGEQRVEWYISIAEHWLEVGEIGPASQAIKRAHALQSEARNLPAPLMLRFRSAYARILDGERRFLEASTRYLELSNTVSDNLTSERDRLDALEYAVTCAILAKAGSQRDALLAKLCSDPRSINLQNYNLLQKVYKRRIVRPDEVKKFESTLSEHQNASTSSGMTVLQNSIIEHNILAVSKLYENITFQQLANILDITPIQAEQLASSMIESNRLNASIDQPSQTVLFQHTDTVSCSSSPSQQSTDISASSKLKQGGNRVLSNWDAQIASICAAVDSAAQRILVKHPQYVTLLTQHQQRT